MTDIYDFQDDNKIIKLSSNESEGADYFKFEDSYTITIYNCAPKGVNGEEFYVELNSPDDALVSFLSDIFVSLDIDGSLEKTIINNLMITLIHDEITKFFRQNSMGTVSIPNRHVKMLGEHYHLLENCPKINITLIAEHFKVLSDKYLVMNFNLKSLTIQKTEDMDLTVGSLGDGHRYMRHRYVGPKYSLDDYLELQDELVTAEDSVLNDICDEQTGVFLTIMSS